MPLYSFTHPVVGYPQDIQFQLINEYAALIAHVNLPQMSFIGVSGVEHPSENHTTVETRQVNREGYWTLVLHTVFLHHETPGASIDVIALSDDVAPTGHNNIIQAPS